MPAEPELGLAGPSDGALVQAGLGAWPSAVPGQSRVEHDLALYRHGFALMAAGAYHPAHDAWEDLWLRHHGPARPFYQGLIQATAACHHAQAGRWRPALALLPRVRAAWAGLGLSFLGADLADFLAQLAQAETAWAEGQAAPLPTWRFQAPSLADFSPHAGAPQPRPMPGHAYAWDLLTPGAPQVASSAQPDA